MSTSKKIEYGDFQTPPELADKMVSLLQNMNFKPSVVVEPTCGLGSILLSAVNSFSPSKSLGIELQEKYLRILKNKNVNNLVLLKKNIFDAFSDIDAFINGYDQILFIGNPPWVTNTTLSVINGNNLPQKKNIDNLRGIEAITGKSNFDISESILLELIEKYNKHKTVFAFLCKTIVARNLLKRLWKTDILYKAACVYPIDAKQYFNAAVDACFFILDCTEKKENRTFLVYDSIDSQKLVAKSGYVNNKIVNDVSNTIVSKIGGKSNYVWRNGIKHDCAKIMEFEIINDQLFNSFGKKIQIEDDLLYPLLKSSDLSKDKICIHKNILVTQRFVGEDTSFIKNSYPKTWHYLMDNKVFFEKRKSIIYRNKPLFSVFSVGEYSFKPYKIAISGLYKNIKFQLLSTYDNKSVMVDDTCNYISFDSEDEAKFIYGLLTSEIVTEYLGCIISWNSKRPITTEILNSIDLLKVATVKNVKEKYLRFCINNNCTKYHENLIQNSFKYA
jgi:hypothetical protein